MGTMVYDPKLPRNFYGSIMENYYTLLFDAVAHQYYFYIADLIELHVTSRTFQTSQTS